jgi:hypothetical protein
MSTQTVTIQEAEEAVWEHLGEDAKVAKVNGYWIIGSKAKAQAEGGFGRISPQPPPQVARQGGRRCSGGLR